MDDNDVEIRDSQSGSQPPLAAEEAVDRERLAWRRLCDARLDRLVLVQQPLVLISQIQRSGGTLLSQLFDGHPECHAHPHELKIGKPEKWNWPWIDPQLPVNVLFKLLYEVDTQRFMSRGYWKGSKGADERIESFPMISPYLLQQKIFKRLMTDEAFRTPRTILDHYFSSYFNAWLDNRNLTTGLKRFVTAFVPRLNMVPKSVGRFHKAYPDGFLISIVRDPQSWFLSARKHSPRRFESIEESTALWKQSTEAIIANHQERPEKVIGLDFRCLLSRTEAVMRTLADRIGITYGPQLLTPTFNGQPIQSNTSFKADGFGVRKEPLTRTGLTPAEIDFIDRETRDLYQTALLEVCEPVARTRWGRRTVEYSRSLRRRWKS